MIRWLKSVRDFYKKYEEYMKTDLIMYAVFIIAFVVFLIFFAWKLVNQIYKKSFVIVTKLFYIIKIILSLFHTFDIAFGSSVDFYTITDFNK